MLQPPLESAHTANRTGGAHPRSRGENRLPIRTSLPPPWLIPAHAGKTAACTRRRRGIRAHPRSRGENRGAGDRTCLTSGSSPLTRGKRGRQSRGRLAARLIPAHAGKTSHPAAGLGTAWAHPRSRGENEAGALLGIGEEGSSPLTRGKPNKRVRALLDNGLIPAHAGKTCPPPRCPARRRAHPRSRGENGPGRGGPSAGWGSSPLTRGKQREKVGRPPDRGLIPAHAGKTEGVPVVLDLQGAHPRSRGENAHTPSTALASRGSSPLTRGNPGMPFLGL